MRSTSFMSLTMAIIIASFTVSFSQTTTKQQCIFKSSLHYTSSGMDYWYDKNQGGLETVTGVPYSDLACKNCHIENCDVCHKVEKDIRIRRYQPRPR